MGYLILELSRPAKEFGLNELSGLIEAYGPGASLLKPGNDGISQLVVPSLLLGVNANPGVTDTQADRTYEVRQVVTDCLAG